MTKDELTEALALLGYDENGKKIQSSEEEVYREEDGCLIIDFRKWRIKNAS